MDLKVTDSPTCLEYRNVWPKSAIEQHSDIQEEMGLVGEILRLLKLETK